MKKLFSRNVFTGRRILWSLVGLVVCATLAFAGTPQTLKFGARLADEGAAHSTPPSGYGDIYINSDVLYFKTDGGSETNLLTAGSTAWDDIGDPDGNNAVTLGGFTTVFTSTLDNGIVWKIDNTDADLANDTILLELEFTDNGDANGIFFRARDNNADNMFVIGANGATTITGTAEGTDALTITGGDITLTDGDVILSGGDIDVTGDLTVSGTASIGTILMNSVTAATATQTLALNGDGVGGVNIGSVSTGDITLGADVVISDGKNVTIGEGTLTIDNDATAGTGEDALVITSSATTTNSAIDVTSANTTSQAVRIVATATSSGDVLYLGATEATLAGGGNYIQAWDGGATDWKVGRYGATTIAGNASTDVLTITAGDIQVTNGDIDLDNGQLMVDTSQDLSNNISRNFAGAGTAAVLVVNDDNTSSTNIALDVNQDGTAASTGVRIVHDGDGAALDITAGAARTGNVIDIAMANQVAQNGILIDGTWTGASDIGMINLNPSGSIAAGASALRIDTDTGTPGASGFGIEIDDDSVDGGTFYALLINSANNEGLHVEAGISLFAETATFTAGLASNGQTDVNLSTNAANFDITSGATDYEAGTGIVTIYQSGAGGATNSTYLLRLAYVADGDAEDNFILAQDNSSGVTDSGDTMFKVDSGGAVTMAGTLTVNGAQIVGDGATEMVGVKYDVVDSSATSPYAVTIAMSGTVFYNSQASHFDLPEASTAIGTEYTFAVGNASNLDVNPDNADIILNAADSVGDMIRSSTVGDTVTLVAISASQWIVKSMYPAATDWADAN